MDIDKNLTLLKNTLISAEKSLTVELCQLEGNKSESREFVVNIIDQIKPYFQNNDFSRNRSMHLILFVNAVNNHLVSDLENDKNIGHVVNFLPQLSSYMYIKCVLDLDLLDFVGETILFAPMPLVSELLSMAIMERKYLNDYEVYRLNLIILNSCVTRIKFDEDEDDRYVMLECFKSVMIYYKIRNDIEDLSGLTLSLISDEDIVAMGYRILCLLGVIQTLLKLTFNMIPDQDFIQLYDIQLNTDMNSLSDFSETDAKQMIYDCLELVADKYKRIACELDVSMFIHWHECSCQGDTLQNVIGDVAYYVCRILANNKSSPNMPEFTDELESLTQFLARKPPLAEEPNFEENLSREEIQKLIFEDLNLFGVQKVKTFLSEENHNFSIDHTTELVMKLCSKNRPAEIEEFLAREVALLALSKLKYVDLLPFYEKFVEEYGIENILRVDDVDVDEMIKKLKEYSNKELSYSPQYSKILKKAFLLGFQSPENLVNKLVAEAVLLENEQYKILMVLKALKPVCTYVSKDTGSKVEFSVLLKSFINVARVDFEKLPKNNKSLFRNMLVATCNEGLVDSDPIMAYCLLPMMYLRNNNWDLLGDYVMIFKDFYLNCVKKSNLSTVVIMVHLAQLLEQTGWTLNTFSVEKYDVRKNVSYLMNIFLKEFLSKKDATLHREEKWLSTYIRRFSPLTRSYFTEIFTLTNSPSIEWQFMMCIHGKIDSFTKIKILYEQQPAEIVIPFSQLVSSLTAGELESMVRNFCDSDPEKFLIFLDILSNAITTLCRMVGQNDLNSGTKSINALKCISFLIFNTLELVRVFATDLRYTPVISQMLRYVNRNAVALQCFSGTTPGHEISIVRLISLFLPLLEKSSRDLDEDLKQVILGLFMF